MVETAEVEVSAIPEIRDAEGRLLKLKGKDFPKSKEGKLAFCDYQIARWDDKKKDVEAKYDPKKKKLRKLEKLQAQLAKLEAEIASEAAA